MNALPRMTEQERTLSMSQISKLHGQWVYEVQEYLLSY